MKITIRDLKYVYEDGTQGLSGIDLVIENGLFGLLGPNASGKTTLMRILATLLKPSSGSVTIDRYDLAKNRAEIRSMTGFLPQRFGTFTRTTTWEFLDYTARLAGLHRSGIRKAAVDEMLESLGLSEVRNRPANDLNAAMKRHLEIAQAVIGNPKILLVDEPTVGLSPEERIRFKNLLTDKLGAIEVIIMSTHILSDITSTCKAMAILDKGNVVFKDSPEALFDRVKQFNPSFGMSLNSLDDAKTTQSIISMISEFGALDKSPNATSNT